MSAILKFDFQKREQLRFSEVNYLNYIKKTQFLHVTTTFPLKQVETRTSHGPIPHPLSTFNYLKQNVFSDRIDYHKQLPANCIQIGQWGGKLQHLEILVRYLRVKACVYLNAGLYTHTYIFRHVKSII